jgi:hypothetical protein
MQRLLRSIALLATASLSTGLLLASGPASSGVVGAGGVSSSRPTADQVTTETDGAGTGRFLADIDPAAPIEPRIPIPKWHTTGIGSLEARIGAYALKTDRIIVKFRDDLKVRLTGEAGAPLRSDATPPPAGGVNPLIPTDPESELRDANALVQAYGGRIEPLLPFAPAKLREIELRAERIGRKRQPDLAGMMMLTVSGNPSQAAEAFNALESVEYAEVELLPTPAQQCNPVDQALQKGGGAEGANADSCNPGTDALGNSIRCAPGPIFPVFGPLANPPTSSPSPGSVVVEAGNGTINCNRPSNFGGYIPQNVPVVQAGLCTPSGTVQWEIDLGQRNGANAIPVWDCTPNCNANLCQAGDGVTYVQGGRPDCQYGCSEPGCSAAVAVYQPSCAASGASRGWDALCATLANIVCPSLIGVSGQQDAIPYLMPSIVPVGPNPAQDNLTTYCYFVDPPTDGVGASRIFQPSDLTVFDPCFAARGPMTPLGVFGIDGAVVFTDIAEPGGLGIRPWGFLFEDPANTSAYAFLQYQTPSGAFAPTTNAAGFAYCPFNFFGGVPFGIGASPIGGLVLAADPSSPDNASLATFDNAFKSYPFQLSHDCFTQNVVVPGCFQTQCCVYVCNVDPTCCIQSWDASCVDLARQAPTCLCDTGGMSTTGATPNWNVTTCGTPDFSFVPVDAAGAPQARNLQTYTTARRVVASTNQYITLAAPTTGGLIPLNNINSQDGATVCNAIAPPQPAVGLDQTFAFLNAQFSGGGLDLEGLEAWALGLTGVTAAVARGSGVTVGLIDNACNVNHEDLVGQVIVEPGQTTFTTAAGIIDPDHGAAVIGEILAASNGVGITGIAPSATGVFFPAVSLNGRGRLSAALVSAGNTLQPGDVLVIPMQVGFGGGATLPSVATYNTLLGVTASLGITNVVSAGNGGFAVQSPPSSSSNNSVVVTACWPGSQVPLPIIGPGGISNPGNSFPGNGYCRYLTSNYTTGVVGNGSTVDVSAWGTAVCTLGKGTLFNVPGSSNRSYQQDFGGTSAAAGMIGGLVARVQAISKAYLGAGVSGERMRQVLADLVVVNGSVVPGAILGTNILQCDLPPVALPGTNSAVPSVVALGDSVFPPTQVNRIGGFPRALEVLQNTVLTPFFPVGVPFTISVISGTRLNSTEFAAANLDGTFYRTQAARRGRGTVGTGYGRPLPYAGSGLITDLQLRANLSNRDADDMFDFTVQTWGRVNVGNVGAPNSLSMVYVWNNLTKRWFFLTSGFLDSSTPTAGSTPQMAGGVYQRGVQPGAVLVPETGGNFAYVRILTFGLGILGPYQSWWDQIIVDTNRLVNP